MAKNTEKYEELLENIFAMNEFKKMESLIQKINKYSNSSHVTEFLCKLQEEKEAHQISGYEIKQFERLLISLENDCDERAIHVENLFLKIYFLIESEKIYLKRAQNQFYESLEELITILQSDSEKSPRKLKIPMLGFQTVQSLTLPSYSKEFTSEITEIFESNTFKLESDNFSKRECCTEALCNIITFLNFGLGGIKWITEFEQIFKRHKKPMLLRYPKKGPILSEQMENLLSCKLSLLEEIIHYYRENKLFFEKSERSEKKLKLLSMIEMLTLDLMTILGCLPNCLSHNAFFLDHDYPIINGKNLRNRLAHGNALLSIVLGDDSTDMLLNAEKMGTKDLLNPEQHIGKKIKSNPQKARESHDEDLSAVYEQQRLFDGLMMGEIETVKDCLSKGADMFGIDLHLQTTLHFVAKGGCLETLKFVSEFSIDVSAIDNYLQSALHVASFNGRSNIVEYLIQDLLASINRRTCTEELLCTLHLLMDTQMS
ncbi:unnamed protein product [Larinioides sclopetarius]|uniref:Uncharacterized protein n=1 Tax=Larinioides sclopetarius TaxID=280406 RepID=A0AAV2AFA0_9ARAC